MLDLELVTPPAVELVSLDELKAHLRYDAADQDAYIASCRAAALAHLDGYAGVLGRAMVQQTWRLYLDRFPHGRIRLPLPPLRDVEAITYVDGDGVTQTLAALDYTFLDGERAEIWPAYGKSWPSTRCQPRAVSIRFRCGWEPPAEGAAWPSKLQPAIAAIKLMVGDLFENRESGVVGTVSAEIKSYATIANLLRPLRIPRV